MMDMYRLSHAEAERIFQGWPVSMPLDVSPSNLQPCKAHISLPCFTLATCFTRPPPKADMYCTFGGCRGSHDEILRCTMHTMRQCEPTGHRRAPEPCQALSGAVVLLEETGAAPVLPDGLVAGNCSALLRGASEARTHGRDGRWKISQDVSSTSEYCH